MATASKVGIRETSELVSFLVELGVGLSGVLGDGFQVDDLIVLLPVAREALPAMEGAGEILAEMRDLDADEAAQILQLVENRIAGRLPHVGDRALKIASATWRMVPPLLDLVDAVRK